MRSRYHISPPIRNLSSRVYSNAHPSIYTPSSPLLVVRNCKTHAISDIVRPLARDSSGTPREARYVVILRFETFGRRLSSTAWQLQYRRVTYSTDCLSGFCERENARGRPRDSEIHRYHRYLPTSSSPCPSTNSAHDRACPLSIWVSASVSLKTTSSSRYGLINRGHVFFIFNPVIAGPSSSR